MKPAQAAEEIESLLAVGDVDDLLADVADLEVEADEVGVTVIVFYQKDGLRGGAHGLG